MTENEVRRIVRDEIELSLRDMGSRLASVIQIAYDRMGQIDKPPHMSYTEAANLIELGEDPMSYA